ncbi:MAG: addiction module protein [Polyangiales bacterium]
MSPDVRAAIERMSREEQLELLDELWALLRDDRLPVPQSHLDELQRRADIADRDGATGDDWETVRDRLRRSS